jgi:hypothetical protein
VAFKKRVRIIKKIRQAPSLWRFISLDRVRYIWDKRQGYYFIEWWEGKKRKRAPVGLTPTGAIPSPSNPTTLKNASGTFGGAFSPR